MQLEHVTPIKAVVAQQTVGPGRVGPAAAGQRNALRRLVPGGRPSAGLGADRMFASGISASRARGASPSLAISRRSPTAARAQRCREALCPGQRAALFVGVAVVAVGPSRLLVRRRTFAAPGWCELRAQGCVRRKDAMEPSRVGARCSGTGVRASGFRAPRRHRTHAARSGRPCRRRPRANPHRLGSFAASPPCVRPAHQ